MKTIEVKKKKITVVQNVAKIYPKLEDLTITPSREQQIFNHPNSDGYDNVIVKAVDDLSGGITPVVEGNVLILSSGNVEGGVLSI